MQSLSSRGGFFRTLRPLGYKNRRGAGKLDSAMAREKNNQGGKDGFELVADNRKARHDFFIEESLEAGLALVGTEVKSLRGHRVNLRDSYARIKNGEAFLHGVHIGTYAPAGQFSHKETRPRKLLMHRREIDRLWGRVRERGYSLVPLKIYFKDGRAKVEIALAKGKHLYDKRQAIARKTTRREIERTLKGRNR
jgi:SsrA-binding protein